MELTLKHDPEVDAWTLHAVNCHLKEQSDIFRWKLRIFNLLSEVTADGPIALLIDIADFSIKPELGGQYQEVAGEVVRRFTHCTLRYGHPRGWTLSAMKVAAEINNYSAEVYADRESALEALIRHRAAQA